MDDAVVLFSIAATLFSMNPMFWSPVCAFVCAETSEQECAWVYRRTVDWHENDRFLPKS